MGHAVRDDNQVPNLLGVSSVDLITPIPLMVDPITHRLLVVVTDTDPNLTPVVRKNAKHDANNVPTMLGWNNSTKTTQALITHNGYLALQAN